MAGFFDYRFSSKDRGSTEQFLSEHYGSVGLSDGLRGIDITLVGDQSFQLGNVQFTGVHSAVAETDSFVIASATSPSGWQDAADTGDMFRQPVLFLPGTSFRSHTNNTARRSVSFDPLSLEHTARALYGVDDFHLDFDGSAPVSQASSALWLRSVDVALAHQKEGLIENDIIRASLHRLLAVCALESFRLVGDRSEAHASAERQRRTYRVATQFFHDYASLPITVDDAASASGTSVRGLVAAFRALDPMQTSPTAYLRTVRIMAAYEDLRAGDPTLGDTVDSIGQRWGLGPSRRFAAQFRQIYGVTPKWVLDR